MVIGFSRRPLTHLLPFLDAKQEKHHRSLPVTETHVLNDLQPNTLYYIWLAAKSKRGEGATTPPIAVRTDQYGKSQIASGQQQR